jgi:phosphatidate cytidylyltransferase
MALALVVAGGAGLAAGPGFALASRAGRGVPPRMVLARAFTYLVLAVVLAAALVAGVAGVTALLGGLAAVALLEWARLSGLPPRHVVATQLANLAVFASIAWRGTAAADVLIGGLAFAAALLPVVRPDVGRAFRDFGAAAAGLIVISVLLVHGVALVVERGAVGAALVGAIAVGCAGSDVGAFLVGRRFGRTPLAPTLSPNKTREGLVGNFLGAAAGIALAIPALLSVVGWPAIAGLVVVVAVGSVWGDLLESAAKREFGVKDAGSWLPGFGGILDRIDSLLLAMPLVYWWARLIDPAHLR